MNAEDPTPPPGLSPAQTYRWVTGHRHLTAADQTDINALDDAGRIRHHGRLRATIDDLLRLVRDVSKPVHTRPEGDSDVL